jgi:conjugal transfer pilus assembly protein TraF
MDKIFLMMFCVFFSASSTAGEYYDKHETGWFWFDDPAKNIEKPLIQKPLSAVDPIKGLEAVKLKIKAALDNAILNPTTENIKNYIILQNAMSQRANLFSNTWKEVLMIHPELDYSIAHPTNNVALQVYHEKVSLQKNAILEKFAEHSGLFFFYRSNCPYCQRFAPILAHFALAHHIVVIPITMDGKSLPEFPNSAHDSGQAKKFNVTVEPSLYAVDPVTQKAYPVAYGLSSETELEDNIYNVMTHYQRDSA